MVLAFLPAAWSLIRCGMSCRRHGDGAGNLLIRLGLAISIDLAADDRARPRAQTGSYHGTALAAGLMTDCCAGRATDSAADNGASSAIASSRCGCTHGSACRTTNDGACLTTQLSSNGCASRASDTAAYGRFRSVAGPSGHG